MLNQQTFFQVLNTACGFREGDSILVGVSGGADSVALLVLAHACGIPVAAAHVNYGLRGNESDEDEKSVSEFCAKLNVPLYTRRTNREEITRINNNVQAAAREFRYSFFREIAEKESMSWIAVAHNLEDQLETVLMNMMRGTGLHGLAGMDIRKDTIIRPLLHTSRQDIEAFLSEKKIAWRNDSSNDSDDYVRNRLRHHVVPELQKAGHRGLKGFQVTLSNLADDLTLSEEAIRVLKEKIVTEKVSGIYFSKAVLRQFAQPRLLLNHLLNNYGFDSRFSEPDYSRLEHAQPGKIYLSGGMQLSTDRNAFILSAVAEGTSEEYCISESVHHPDWSVDAFPVENLYAFSSDVACIDHAKLIGQLIVRPWKAGDSMQPTGFHGTKKVSDILTEMKIPSHMKSKYPVLTHQDQVVWIPGYRIAENFKVSETTESVLVVKWNKP